MRWARLSFGLGLAAVAGAVFGHAWTAEAGAWWWVGVLTLLAGVLLVLSGLYARTPPVKLRSPPREEGHRLPPLLGELLVHKQRLITQRQLARALAATPCPRSRRLWFPVFRGL